MHGPALAKLEKPRPRRFSKAALGATALAASLAAHGGDPLRGVDLYRQHCSACHGVGGKPVLPTAPDFTRPTALLKPDLALMASIRQGRGAMPAYDGVLRERDILDIVAHLRTLR